MCQYSLINLRNTLMKDVNNREIECGIYGNFLLSAHFFSKPTTVLKIKPINKKKRCNNQKIEL